MRVIAETGRLILAKVTLQDAPFFLELLNTPNYIKYVGDRKIRTLSATKEYLQNGILKSYQKYGFGFYKILLKSEELKTIGICGLIKRDELKNVDIGFGFLPEYEGRGFGFESANQVLKLAQHHFGLKTVAAVVSRNNSNSIKLLSKLGLDYQKKVIPFEDGEELLLYVISFGDP
jgi:RimJ/RimL family protein N-acetyltransferase